MRPRPTAPPLPSGRPTTPPTTNTPQTCHSATPGDPPFQLPGPGPRSLPLEALPLALSALRLLALQALGTFALFLLEELAAQNVGAHVCRGALRGGGHGGGLRVLEDADGGLALAGFIGMAGIAAGKREACENVWRAGSLALFFHAIVR